MGLWCGDGLGISLLTSRNHTSSYCIMQNCRVAEILQMHLLSRVLLMVEVMQVVAEATQVGEVQPGWVSFTPFSSRVVR